MNVRLLTHLLVVSLLLLGCCTSVPAQTNPKWDSSIVTRPPSGIRDAGDTAITGQTSLLILGSRAIRGLTAEVAGPPVPNTPYETPASLACIYNLQPGPAGCDPYIVTANPYGGKGAIAIVDAYDDPNAFADLQYFSRQFGLTPVKAPGTRDPGTPFSVVYAPPGSAPPGSCTGSAVTPKLDVDSGWDIEASVDIEYAHAMAPSALLYLVEAQSNGLADFLCAVTVAGNLVASAGGGDVSISWIFDEFSDEAKYDSIFTVPGVVYFAASGDRPGVYWPSSSPNVISVGGTTLATNPASGQFQAELPWASSGGGVSAYEPRPVYQDVIASVVGSCRGTPDVAVAADPYTRRLDVRYREQRSRLVDHRRHQHQRSIVGWHPQCRWQPSRLHWRRTDHALQRRFMGRRQDRTHHRGRLWTFYGVHTGRRTILEFLRRPGYTSKLQRQVTCTAYQA